MGISISHGVPSTRSALTLSNLGQHLAHTLTGSEWRELSDLFDGRLDLPMCIPPAQAGRIGELLHKAAGHRAMEPGWGELAILIGDAAKRAAHLGQNWEWS
ncbi:hypothetical protein AB0M57_04610 [Streptomyces sp. NPDC051597]|uniref:DUF7739 domain-containing protein n=1 Tax=Streptomyces sp. NPDC051597 TaxID=3155049 RepID=UPI003434D261